MRIRKDYHDDDAFVLPATIFVLAFSTFTNPMKYRDFIPHDYLSF